ncbi:MAG: hypothetical protein A4S09_04255 [Proteobacteria bacterium SG_bin7]|nr:MAG: hypothetical protein A4S09_04255 [Proteobacteria bacterium SG_bin7]
MNKKVSDFIAAGYVAGAHGIRGEIILVSQINDLNLLDDCINEGICLGKDEKVLSLAVDSIRPHKGSFLILSRDITDRNKAESLKGYSWLISKEKMVSNERENIFLHEIEGFTVVDNSKGVLGKIVSFSSNGAQDLIEIMFLGRKVFIPLVKAFLDKIDFKEKIVHMKLPPGLVDWTNEK